MAHKGRQVGGFKLLFILCWLGGEFFGAVAGVMITGATGLVAYLLALAGAAGGGWFTYSMANAAQSSAPTDRATGGFPVIQSTQPQNQKV